VPKVTQRRNPDFPGRHLKGNHCINPEVGLPEREPSLKTVAQNRIKVIPTEFVTRIIAGVNSVEIRSPVGQIIIRITTNIGSAEVPITKRSFLEEQLIVNALV
jgi:hypothetical protein